MATTTLMSFAEFECVDHGSDQVELLEGELIRMPPPEDEHMEVCERLYDRLKAALERLQQTQPGLPLGRVHMERGYRFLREPPSWLRPNVSVTHPNQRVERFLIGAPLLVFEVVSESDRAGQLQKKVSAYLANGAAEVWLIYPQQREAWVYETPRAARQETRAIQSPHLPSIEVPMEEILPTAD